ncbi:MAG: DUF2202 domain-containing protein [Methanomicrobiales archaeon]|nr:DUF2202 domain-containing protein [Methanomicrobiales archaeon]
MKNRNLFVILILIVLVIVIPVSAAKQGYGNRFQENQNLTLPEPQDYDLSDTEITDLLFMREEEQMAHDLYMVWYEMYSIPIFRNIGEAETTHASEVQFLLDRYQVPSDMIGNLSSGYHNPDIQTLAAALADQGAQSLTDALKAGVAIEETDIADLDKAIANTTRPDIIQVYTNLRNGSENHLSAFTRQLS